MLNQTKRIHRRKRTTTWNESSCQYVVLSPQRTHFPKIIPAEISFVIFNTSTYLLFKRVLWKSGTTGPFSSWCRTVKNAADANWRSGGILQKTQKRVWCQLRCQWQPLLSLCCAFCFPWHLSNTKWCSEFDDNELAIQPSLPPQLSIGGYSVVLQ